MLHRIEVSNINKIELIMVYVNKKPERKTSLCLPSRQIRF